ncbi:polysaccharide pyruvyl transferase family protein [Galbitalea sp. SE-J8]|uniref:polysaccharide pyruvyl transferase family protein n=1 Tax=Galbitalea sp. SE-J8 TaxID=3054952 RepID=UPI00259CB00E|nr:polysaccharide pyruvyl transferase family protein [Galbitalea sp. SE-J8]MDM4763912.1 polysaccharide pyruvyl transferase family protein [Galbitalea sp. SE-J8]
MSRILLRAGKSPFQVFTPEQSLAVGGTGVFGANAGNLLFSGAVHRALSVPDAEVVTDGFVLENLKNVPKMADHIDERYDHVVLPFANAFRPGFAGQLATYAELIERLHVPVTVVGVGAQMAVGADRPDAGAEFDEVVARFVRAVLARSATLGVRGARSAAYLAQLGFGPDAIDVIGCPSLFTERDGFAIRPRDVTRESRIDLTYTGGLSALVDRAVERYPRLEFVAQEHHRLRLLLEGADPAGYDGRGPLGTGHPLYRDDRIRFFVDARTWTDHLAGFDLAFGTRIHGAIAALLARVPAIVLAYDSRTLELAEYHGIPHRDFHAVGPGTDVATLAADADLTEFHARFPELAAHYRAFLTANGLAHIWQDGGANPGYDARLAALELPPAVRRPRRRLLGRRAAPAAPIARTSVSELIARRSG